MLPGELLWRNFASAISLSGMIRLSSLRDSTWKTAVLSSVVCWLATPPVGWGLLAWVAPVGWLACVGRENLAGERPYRALWAAGTVFWLLTIHWLRLPHPANYLAWFLLASYLGCYLPVFVALSRVGVHRLGLPLWLVAPVVWTGLEGVRAHLMTGFLMGSLAHTQVEYPLVIQIANLAGEYGVTFLIVLVAACLVNMADARVAGWRRLGIVLPGVVALGLALIYGQSERAKLALPQQGAPAIRVALIQGNTLADWKSDLDRQQEIMAEYFGLSLGAVRQSQQHDGREVDVMVWPETSFRQPLWTIADGFQPPAEQFHESYFQVARSELREFVRQTGAAILTGIDRAHVVPNELGQPDVLGHNSSVAVNKQGEVVGIYDKMHLVIMGEYVPFTDWLPILKRLTPITGLAEPGEHPQAMELENRIFCPNICYETVVPHLIRDHVTQLAKANQMPDVLVNLTNDSWFWGSSELEMHLACGVFRAVEMRLPLLIAANGGLSAHIEPSGRVLQVTPRQQPAVLLVDLPKIEPQPLTFYAQHGDWFAGICVICCTVLAIFASRDAMHRRSNACRLSRSDDAS